jgi:transposase
LGDMDEQERIAARYAHVAGVVDERGRRAVAAAEALAWGRGGIAAVTRATGLSPQTIRNGIKELRGAVTSAAPGRIRRAGGGRKKLVATDPTVCADLERLVEPTTRGDPESPLRWTCKSVRKLVAALCDAGHRVSHQWVAEALHALGYSLQGNRKMREGSANPDRDAQFAHINAAATAALAAGEPVISVDTNSLSGKWGVVVPSGHEEERRCFGSPQDDAGRADDLAGGRRLVGRAPAAAGGEQAPEEARSAAQQ